MAINDLLTLITLIVAVVLVTGLIVVSLAAASGAWSCPRSLGGELVGDDCHLAPMTPVSPNR